MTEMIRRIHLAKFKHEFFAEIYSLNPLESSRFNLKAIAETRLVVIAKNDMDFLYTHISAWEVFGRMVLEELFCQVDQMLNVQPLSEKNAI